jgi:hypothetical protein
MAMIVNLNATKLQFSPARAMRRLRPTAAGLFILGSSMAFIDGTVVRCAAGPAVRPGSDDSGSSLGALLLTR